MWLPDCLGQRFCIFSRIKGFNTEPSSYGKVMVACVCYGRRGATGKRRRRQWALASQGRGRHDQMSHLCVAQLARSAHRRASVPLLLLTRALKQPVYR